MKILLNSHHFDPSVGGLETASRILASEFSRLGHDVIVVTQTGEESPRRDAFRVVRQPGAWQLLSLVRWCDVFLHNAISVRTAWPLLLARRPWVVAHHMQIARPSGARGWQDLLKRSLLRFATNISVSRSMAGTLPVPSTVIGNPYREDLFAVRSDAVRDKDLVFLGRLVPDKGMDLLLDALVHLKKHAIEPRLTVIGSGPERDSLIRQAAEAGLGPSVSFLGSLQGLELAECLNRHKIMVVPSRCEEAFGIVALEGIACGCLVVGSDSGGLKEAIGPCGTTVPNGNGEALAGAILAALSDPDLARRWRTEAPAHLARHRGPQIAAQYLAVMEGAVRL